MSSRSQAPEPDAEGIFSARGSAVPRSELALGDHLLKATKAAAPSGEREPSQPRVVLVVANVEARRRERTSEQSETRLGCEI